MAENPTSVSSSRSLSARRWVLMLAFFALVVAVLGGLKYLQIKKAIEFGESFPERSETVTAVIATPESWQQRYRTIGEVLATRYVELLTEVNGKISEIGFVGGDAVEAGQVLVLLDSTEERAELQATRARLKLAELQLKRLDGLRANKLASENEYDSAVADRDILLANLAELTARIEKKTLLAPFDAQTGLHTLQVGQYLPANAVVTELTGGAGELWVDFNLPQGKATLSIGDPVEVTSRSVSDFSLTAFVVSADASLNLQSRSRGYRALLTDPPEAIRPGSVVDVEVIIGDLEGVFRLPASAVRRNNFGAFVYVLKEAEPDAIARYRAERRPVTLGPAEGEDIALIGGLEPGERVAALGAFKLIDGLLTHVAVRDSDVVSELAPSSSGDLPLESAR